MILFFNGIIRFFIISNLPKSTYSAQALHYNNIRGNESEAYMQTIYIDVLIILNIYVNFLIIKTTARLTHSKCISKRCIVASVYGSLYSLLILIPDMNLFLNIFIKIIATLTINIISFGLNMKNQLFINSITFMAVNFIFAGAVYAVYSWFKPDFIHFNNTYFYIDFSLIILVLTTTLLYFCVCVFRYIFDKIPDESDGYKIIIRYKGKFASLSGFADTGNSLVDFFSGLPVIICDKNEINQVANVLNIEALSEIPKGFRLIPYSTISSESLIPIFKPDEIIIFNLKHNTKKCVDAMIGIIDKSDAAIFNPKILKL